MKKLSLSFTIIIAMVMGSMFGGALYANNCAAEQKAFDDASKTAQTAKKVMEAWERTYDRCLHQEGPMSCDNVRKDVTRTTKNYADAETAMDNALEALLVCEQMQ